MSRGQGSVFRPSVRGGHTKIWWLDYAVHGQRHKESSHCTSKRDAQRILRQRIDGRESGRIVARPERVTVGDLKTLVEKQYDLDRLRSKARIKQCWAHVVEFFGTKAKVLDVTPTRLDDYATKRLADGVERGTVNRELAALRRGFKLAVEKGILGTMPVIKLPKERNARSGFFEDGDFAAVLLELPAFMRPLIRFLRLTGWRVGEAVALQWKQVDRVGETIRLSADQTKGGDARTFPFGGAAELQELLATQWTARTGDYVFPSTRNGRIATEGSFYKAWTDACGRAGATGRLIHDLRRTAARDFRRAGVSEGEIMKLCGWKTRAMFDRYNIIDEADLAGAVAKRFAPPNGQQTANLGVPQPPEGR